MTFVYSIESQGKLASGTVQAVQIRDICGEVSIAVSGSATMSPDRRMQSGSKVVYYGPDLAVGTFHRNGGVWAKSNQMHASYHAISTTGQLCGAFRSHVRISSFMHYYWRMLRAHWRSHQSYVALHRAASERPLQCARPVGARTAALCEAPAQLLRINTAQLPQFVQGTSIAPAPCHP